MIAFDLVEKRLQLFLEDVECRLRGDVSPSCEDSAWSKQSCTSIQVESVEDFVGGLLQAELRQQAHRLGDDGVPNVGAFAAQPFDGFSNACSAVSLPIRSVMRMPPGCPIAA